MYRFVLVAGPLLYLDGHGYIRDKCLHRRMGFVLCCFFQLKLAPEATSIPNSLDVFVEHGVVQGAVSLVIRNICFGTSSQQRSECILPTYFPITDAHPAFGSRPWARNMRSAGVLCVAILKDADAGVALSLAAELSSALNRYSISVGLGCGDILINLDGHCMRSRGGWLRNSCPWFLGVVSGIVVFFLAGRNLLCA